MNGRLRRVELSTPASSERMVQKAARTGADVCFLDLEDAVAPALKPGARDVAARAFTELDWGSTARAIRINAVGSPWFDDDLEHVIGTAGAAVDLVIVPKVLSADDVRLVAMRLEALEAAIGRTTPIGIEVLIEEAAALVHVNEIAVSSPRLEALIFGSGDYGASQGVRGSRLGELRSDPWSYARNAVLVAARAAGIVAVDGPWWGETRDFAGYGAECEQLAILGFSGKWAIHPDQVPVAAAAFSPTAAELEHAGRVQAAFAEAHERGLGAIEIDGVMADLVDVRMAGDLLAYADRIAAVEGRAEGGGHRYSSAP